jgi:hypothetical protein
MAATVGQARGGPTIHSIMLQKTTFHKESRVSLMFPFPFHALRSYVSESEVFQVAGAVKEQMRTEFLFRRRRVGKAVPHCRCSSVIAVAWRMSAKNGAVVTRRMRRIKCC